MPTAAEIKAQKKAMRAKAKAQRHLNWLQGTHTKRGTVRKNRHTNNCADVARTYGEKLQTTRTGRKYFLAQSRNGKTYRRYCTDYT